MKRNSIHAKNRSGFRKRRRSHLTVVVKELEPPKAEKVKAVSCSTVCSTLDFEFFFPVLAVCSFFDWHVLHFLNHDGQSALETIERRSL
jgi:hypothetical protein